MQGGAWRGQACPHHRHADPIILGHGAMEEILATLLAVSPANAIPVVLAVGVVVFLYREFNRKLTAHDSKNDADFAKVNDKIDLMRQEYHRDATEIKEKIAKIEGYLMKD